MATAQRQDAGTVYELGPFRLDPGAGVLTRASLAQPLGGRAIAVLTALVEQAGEFVSKTRLLDLGWPGLVVEEANLAVQVSLLRRVLASAPDGGQWIETLARRGYRFVGPVSVVRDGEAPPVPQAPSRSNLPEPLTSFVGRERELADIRRLLQTRRLLTLTGVGGIGKTRLALQAAAEALSAYRDGVWMVDLAPLADAALVTSAAAQALGASHARDDGEVAALGRHVRGRELLLLLDNCEHLVAPVGALVVELLRAAPELTILATSREPLHVAGEQSYPVGALSLPVPGADAEAIARSDAVQLFVERARQQRPDFAVAGQLLPEVAAICVHLDGVALALELAAARVRTLSVEQIHARLGDRFRLLTGSDADVPHRQRTLRATLDWSHELLDDPQRLTLRRLAIFPGAFDLEAASFVLSDGTDGGFAAIELLTQLVDRSLVLADTGGGRARYRLLETTRAYALDKLALAGEADSIRRRHAQYFRALLDRASTDWFAMSDADWAAAYLVELDNVRQALDWALRGRGDSPTGIALAAASRSMWTTLGLLNEGRQWIEIALSRVTAQTPESDLAHLYLTLGALIETSDPGPAVTGLQRAATILRHPPSPPLLVYALVLLAKALAHLGRYEEAQRALDEASQPVERSHLPKLAGLYYGACGYLKTRTGDMAGARADIERALALCIEAGTEYAAPATLLGDLTWVLGDLDAAAAALSEVVAMMRSGPMVRRAPLGFALANLAGVQIERGELDEALAAAREGLPLLGEASPLAWMFMDHLGLRHALMGRFADAAHLAGHSDRMHAEREIERGRNEARARDRLHRILRESVSPGALGPLLAEGARLTEGEALRIALRE